ncbi:hypothetical protein PLESTB_000751600 [Pleodorina starrii]|uniref:Uncharacterized protein n=1 Tax=Pleodorina starrii TaxID=330485 RepID=A0A9W6BKC4_9CHLO|nr:hypothetical protein PLESTB_000751600 [Pleodorina starrii]
MALNNGMHIYVKEADKNWAPPAPVTGPGPRVQPRRAARCDGNLVAERDDAACADGDVSDSEQEYAAALQAGEDDEEEDDLGVLEAEAVGLKCGRATKLGGGRPATKPKTDDAIEAAKVLLYDLAAGHLQPDPGQQAPTGEGSDADHGQDRAFSVLVAHFKAVHSVLGSLSKDMKELKSPRPSGRRSSAVEADPVSGKMVLLLRTQPYILKLEDGMAFMREIGDYMGISTDPTSLKSMDREKREGFEAAVRQASGNFRANFKGKAEAAVRTAAIAAYGLAPSTSGSGHEPGGEVAKALLDDNSYRDKPDKRLAAPEFQQCAHAWYVAARRIRKGWKVDLELAEFTLEEMACIDLQVRRTLNGDVAQTTGNNVPISEEIYRMYETRLAIMKRWEVSALGLHVVPASDVLGQMDKSKKMLTCEAIEIAQAGF